jgi:signal transduction histidine kinase/phage shock protein PspC (stress-responsive transcriptional regulator)
MTTAVRRLTRDPAHRVVAGVAAGIAQHLGVPVLAVRLTFVVLLPLNAAGALLYAAFWAVLPAGADPPRRRAPATVLPYLALAAGVLLLASLVGWSGTGTTIGALVALVAVGAGTIWHQADPQRRRRWAQPLPTDRVGRLLADADRGHFIVRVVGGGALVVVGLVGLLAAASWPLAGDGYGPALAGLLYALLALLGLAVVAAPPLWRVLGQLRAEREARIREQERAEVAAMVHDQVLHTLALIQRNAADPRTVQRLARGQERTLRQWLYAPAASPSERLGAALEEVVAEVEDTYAVAVESVVVGDRPVDDRMGALVAATREALVNAARHSGQRTVSLYAEVEPQQCSVFVRDRGPGFDPDRVDPHRHGVRGSIVGRMRRHGGTARIVSAPGKGAEVRLVMPVSDGGERRD